MTKRILIIGIAVVLLAVGATATYFVFRQRAKEIKEEQPVVTAPEEPTESLCITPSPSIPKKKKTGEISGRILLRDKTNFCGIKITVFNGFDDEIVEVYTNTDGTFIAPIVAVSEKGLKEDEPIYISLFVTHDGYLPFVKNLPVAKKIDIPKIVLEPIPDQSQGTIVGVCHISITGGKIRGVHGIYQYVRNVSIGFKDSAGNLYTTNSGREGIFKLLLPPGDYVTLVEGGEPFSFRRQDQVSILRGATTIFNIGGPGIMVD